MIKAVIYYVGTMHNKKGGCIMKKINVFRGKKVICLLMAVIMVLCFALVGCGYKPDTNSKAYEEINDISKIAEKVRAKGANIGDYTYGGSFYNVNPEEPIFEIFVNPVATDDVMDKYVELVLNMQEVLMENKEYVKLVKSGTSYFVALTCHNKNIYNAVLDGNIKAEELKEILYENMQDEREKVSAKLEEHFNYIDSSDIFEKDSEGNYYVVVDTKNTTASLDEIISELKLIQTKDPISFEESRHYIGSSRIMGYVDGSFRLYADNYGNDFVDDITGGPDVFDIEFCYGTHYIYTGVYDDLLDLSEYLNRDDDVKISFSYNIYENGNELVHIAVAEDIDDDTYEYSEEDVTRALYDCYHELLNQCNKYGIVLNTDLEIAGNYNIPTDTYICGVSGSVPLDEEITYDEFASMISFEQSYYFTGMYNLEADCL